MQVNRLLHRRVLLSLLMLSASLTLGAAPRYFILGDEVQLACTQPIPDSLACDYRLVRPAPVLGISAAIGELHLADVDSTLRPLAAGSSAILFLIDTSDPARQPDMSLIAAHLRALLANGEPRHSFGLASFDSDLRLLLPIGSSPEEILSAAARMRATGRTTELYRSTLHAVRILAEYEADRRALFLFSDGLAEDHAYFHEDVIRAARASGVVIYGLGYARSVSLSVALQALRRLAEDSGGYYLQASDHPSLPAAFVEDPFEILENGGGFTVDLSSAVAAGLSDAQRVRIEIELEGGTATATAPVQLPPAPAPEPIVIEKPIIVEKTIVTRVPVISDELQATASTPFSGPGPTKDPMLWYVVAGIGVLVSIVLILVLMLLRRSRKDQDETKTESPEPEQTFGFLEAQDGSDTAHPITSVAFRIGRHATNDLSVDDPSVSRQHAEIHRRRDGSFTITDLNSMNGVFVNNKQLKQSELSEGDSVDLGDVSFKFVIQRPTELSGEETVMVRTLAPPAGSISDDTREIA